LGVGEKFKALAVEYGRIAVVIYLVIFVLVFSGFAVAIMQGVEVESASGTAGTLGAAWVATKLTQPLRIAAALVLTPIFGRLFKRDQKRA